MTALVASACIVAISLLLSEIVCFWVLILFWVDSSRFSSELLLEFLLLSSSSISSEDLPVKLSSSFFAFSFSCSFVFIASCLLASSSWYSFTIFDIVLLAINAKDLSLFADLEAFNAEINCWAKSELIESASSINALTLSSVMMKSSCWVSFVCSVAFVWSCSSFVAEIFSWASAFVFVLSTVSSVVLISGEFCFSYVGAVVVILLSTPRREAISFTEFVVSSL